MNYFGCCCCKKQTLQITDPSKTPIPSQTAGTFIQKQPPNGQIISQPNKIPIGVVSNNHVNGLPEIKVTSTYADHSNPSFVHDEPSEPSVPYVTSNKVTASNPETNVSDPGNQISSSQTIVSSNQNAPPKIEVVGTPIPVIIIKNDSEPAPKPIEESQIMSSQVVVDSSSKSEMTKPEPVEIIIPSVFKMVSTQLAKNSSADDSIDTSQTVTSSSMKAETMSTDLQKEVTPLTTEVNVSQSTSSESKHGDVENQIVSSMVATESSNNTSSFDSQIVGEPIISTIVVNNMESQIASSVITTESSNNESLSDSKIAGESMNIPSKVEIVNIPIPPLIPTPPIFMNTQSELVKKPVEQDEIVSSQVVIDSSAQSEMSTTDTTKPEVFETTTLPPVEMISTHPTEMVTSEIPLAPNVTSQMVTSSSTKVETSDSGFHKEMMSTTTEVFVSQSTISESKIGDVEHQIASSMVATESSNNKTSFDSKIVGEPMISTIVVNSSEVTTRSTEQSEIEASQAAVDEAFKLFVDGIMPTIPLSASTALVVDNKETEISSQTIVHSSDEPNPFTFDKLTSFTTDIIPSQSTSGNEEIKIITTTYTTQGPTTLEVSKSEFQTEVMSSKTEMISSQITTKSVYSHEESEVISSQVIIESSSKDQEKTIADEQFISSIEVVSSPTSVVFNTIQESHDSSTNDNDGPTIIEVNSPDTDAKFETDKSDEISSYIVTEPNVEDNNTDDSYADADADDSYADADD